MFEFTRVYARAVLRQGATWAIVAVAGLVAMAGVSLDLFAFEGGPDRSMGVVLGTFELATALLAIGARVTGVASGESEGFRATVVQSAGQTSVELGSTMGAGVGAAVACWGGLVLVAVFYNFIPPTPDSVLRIALLGPALTIVGMVSAAWSGLGARVAGRLVGVVCGVAALVAARLDAPSVVRACLPVPIPPTTAALLATAVAGALAALGLVLVTAAAPAVGEGTA